MLVRIKTTGLIGWARYIDKGTTEQWWQVSFSDNVGWFLRHEFEAV